MRVEKAFPAIVSKTKFRRVNSLMRSRAPKIAHPRRVASSYLLSGLVKCKACNRALSGQDVTPEGELDVLNASENVIIMVDEAHRAQYGILGGRMSKALPNAVMVGFTGTPIEKDFKRSTIGRFGPLIDTYTIPQSVARVVRYHDEATTPYQRMLQSGALTGARKAVLEKLYLSLNPLRLSRQIEAETEELLRLAWRRGDPLSWSPSR